MSRNKSEVLQLMRSGGLVPVLRASSAEDGFELSLAIADAGIHVLEITLTVPNALLVISRLRKERAELLVGAGAQKPRRVRSITAPSSSSVPRSISPRSPSASVFLSPFCPVLSPHRDLYGLE